MPAQGKGGDRVTLAPDEPPMTTTVPRRNAVGLARIGLVFVVSHDSQCHGGWRISNPASAPRSGGSIGMLPSNAYAFTAAVVVYQEDARLRLSG